MKQQTNKDVLDLLKNKGKITINLVGVSFENRQEILRNMIRDKSPRGITLHSEIDNKYDNYTIIVQNHKGEDIGYIPKQKGFSITIPKRSRPIVFGKYIVDSETNNLVQTNQIFYKDLQENLYVGEIVSYLDKGEALGFSIGVKIQFGRKQFTRKSR